MITDNQTMGGQKPGMSQKQKELFKKAAVYSLMGILFLGFMYLIFAPSADNKANTEVNQGFNTDIPMPKEEALISDKRDAYQQEQMKQKQDERMRSLQDFSALLGDIDNEKTDELAILSDAAPTARAGGGSVSQNRAASAQSRSQTSIQTSAEAYRDMNRTLGNFYEKPPDVQRDDPEKTMLREELEELKMRLDETDNRKNVIDNQLELMEKSFQMAAKYMPGSSGAVGTVGTDGAMGTSVVAQETSLTATTNKTVVVPVDRVREQTVSILMPEMSNAEFMETYSKPRNMGFLTATSEAGAGIKNTVSACVHADQTIMDGQNVRLRLLEPMQAGNIVIPRNTRLTGTARIQGERLGITLNSLEYEGIIIPVELRVYDLDGQSGIFIPNMAELNAAKEIVANMGTSAGTSITLSNDAGKQFAADMGRNAIQGVSQFTAKKLREVKVHLRDGYRVYLLASK